MDAENNEIKSITKAAGKARELSDKDREFCKWYTGVNVGDEGQATELDIVASALNAGFAPKAAKKMVSRVRSDKMLLIYIGVLNKSRRGETMSRVDSYSRRALDVLQGLSETAENETVRLGAAKYLIEVSNLKEPAVDEKERNAMLKAQEEFKDRLNTIQTILAQGKVVYDKFGESKPQMGLDYSKEDIDGDGIVN